MARTSFPHVGFSLAEKLAAAASECAPDFKIRLADFSDRLADFGISL